MARSAEGDRAVRTNHFDLTGRRAIVTGASRGLGQVMGRALAKAGADLIVTARDRRDCADFESEIRALGRDVASFSLDVRQEGSIRSFGEQVLDRFPRIDILVNNAGCNLRKPALEYTWEEWNRVLDTNLRGAFFMCQAIGKAMVAQGYGKIINIGSVTSVSGCGGITPYSASRGGVLQMTEALADEWGRFGVNVNVSGPGLVQDRSEQSPLPRQGMGRLSENPDPLGAARKTPRFGWCRGVLGVGRIRIHHRANPAGRWRHLHRRRHNPR